MNTAINPTNSDAGDMAKLDVLERLDRLEETLKSTDPQIPVHLGAIHKTLGQYEELVHLLPDDRIKVLMDAMQKYRKVELVKEAATGKNKRALGKTTLDDI
jgi:hypothetical protein